MKYLIFWFTFWFWFFIFMPLSWHESLLEEGCKIWKYIWWTNVDCKVVILEFYKKK